MLILTVIANASGVRNPDRPPAQSAPAQSTRTLSLGRWALLLSGASPVLEMRGVITQRETKITLATRRNLRSPQPRHKQRFDYEKPAELFMTKRKGSPKQRLGYRRFDGS